MNKHRGPRLRFLRPTAKLSEADIRDILTASPDKTAAQIAEEKDCHESTVFDVQTGVTHRDVAPDLVRRLSLRKPRLSEDEIDHIRKLARNHKPAKVARMVGKLKSTVWRVVKRKSYGEIY